MKVRLEKKSMKMGEVIELPDYSYNHYYNFVGEDRCDVFYLVPETLDDAKKAMSPKSEYLYEVHK